MPTECELIFEPTHSQISEVAFKYDAKPAPSLHHLVSAGPIFFNVLFYGVKF